MSALNVEYSLRTIPGLKSKGKRKPKLTREEKTELFHVEFFPYADALYNFAYHLTRDNTISDDLVQDTFLKAFRFIDGYKPGSNAKAWLFKILKNGFINEYRKKSRRPGQVDFENFLNYQEHVDKNNIVNIDVRKSIFHDLLGDEISNAINNLSVEFRTIILLCDIEGFTYEEISKIIDIPIGTVRSRLFRARQELKKNLKEYASSMGYATN